MRSKNRTSRRLLGLSVLAALSLLVSPVVNSLHAFAHDHQHSYHYHPETGTTHSHDHNGFHRHGDHEAQSLPPPFLTAGRPFKGVFHGFASVGMATKAFDDPPTLDLVSSPAARPASRGSLPSFFSAFNKAPPAC
jgi:hypothetical protein